jgi:hypothetical protein
MPVTCEENDVSTVMIAVDPHKLDDELARAGIRGSLSRNNGTTGDTGKPGSPACAE